MDALPRGGTSPAQDLGGHAAADLEKTNADMESLVAAADDAARGAAQGSSDLAKDRKAAAEKGGALKAAEAETDRLAAATDEAARALLDESLALAAAAGKADGRSAEHEGEAEAAETRCKKAKEQVAAAERDTAALKAKADKLESRAARAQPGDTDALVEEAQAAREVAAAARRDVDHAKAIQKEADQELEAGKGLIAATKEEAPQLLEKVSLQPSSRSQRYVVGSKSASEALPFVTVQAKALRDEAVGHLGSIEALRSELEAAKKALAEAEAAKIDMLDRLETWAQEALALEAALQSAREDLKNQEAKAGADAVAAAAEVEGLNNTIQKVSSDCDALKAELEDSRDLSVDLQADLEDTKVRYRGLQDGLEGTSRLAEERSKALEQQLRHVLVHPLSFELFAFCCCRC